MRYELSSASLVTVTARSSVHDTATRFSRVSGWIDVDPAAPAAGARAEIRVDMRVFDAGDRLRNWKLRGELDAEHHPEATFVLGELKDVRPLAGGGFAATATGILRWRGREVAISATGEAQLDGARVAAAARFELDVRQLGVTPPRFLMFKVENQVAVVCQVAARAA